MLLSALNPSFRGSSGRPAYFHSSRPPVDKELQKLLSEATKMTGRKADKIPIVPRFLQVAGLFAPSLCVRKFPQEIKIKA